MSEKDYQSQLEHAHQNTSRLKKQTKRVGLDYFKLHTDVLVDGALSVKYKELIALSIAITKHCEDCILDHVAAAKKAGASVDEIVETVNVTIMMDGGPAIVYGGKALEAVEQFYDVDLK